MNKKYMGMHHILLPDGTTRQAENLEDVAVSSSQIGTQIAKDHIGSVLISTAFLTIDHNYHTIFSDPDDWESHSPLLFETMIFGGSLDNFQTRYATIEEALVGHEDAVRAVRRRDNVRGVALLLILGIITITFLSYLCS